MDQWAIKAAGVAQALTPLFKSLSVIVAQPRNLCVILQLFSSLFRSVFMLEKRKAKPKPIQASSCLRAAEKPDGR